MSRLSSFGGVVFDLDDTLYPEADYVSSGFDYLGELVQRLYGVALRDKLRQARDEGAADPLGAALLDAGLPSGLKEHLVLAYRYHRPTLTLHPGASELLQECIERRCPLYLVTDGRGVTQRLKLEALGLLNVFDGIFISEEMGVGKPNPLSFETAQRQGGEGPWVYIADNPAKDFQAPNGLGWATIGVRHTSSRVHSLGKVLEPPTRWVEDLVELL